jgi:murein L,D-transpeptidase YcbB/YkuD
MIGLVLPITVIMAAGPFASLCAFAEEPGQEMIRMRLEDLPERPLVANVHLADGRALTALYEQRAFRPAWARRSNAEAFVSLIARAEEEGLKPTDYHWPKLAQMLAERETSLESDLARVDLDLLLTDSLLRYAYHLRFGKVDPAGLYPLWNLSRAMPGPDTLGRLQAIIDSDDPEHLLAEAIPQIPYYRHLKQTLHRYRMSLAQGTWAAIPSGPPLKTGMTDARVRALRERLRAPGVLGYSLLENPSYFDHRLARAVSEFQVRHALTADGVVGRETLAALNVSVSARIDQLRVNMERARWVFQDIEDDYLLVNIAAFEASLFRSGTRVWSARTVVGKPFRQTPVFKSKITYLVFNPTWTVPPTILREDLLPRVKNDPGFLNRQNMTVFDRAGRIIDPHSIAWSTLDPGKFPYTIRQEPGANNAMGKVKFMLPNPYFVYLHDTPDRKLFERADRSFSAGCIRVENAIALAELLLGDSRKWDGSAIASAIDSRRTRTVPLTRPMTTMLLYWTNDVDAAGNVYFLKDVYDRDRAVLEALDGPFVFSPPTGFGDQFPNIR